MKLPLLYPIPHCFVQTLNHTLVHDLRPSSGAHLDDARVHCLLVILLAKLGGAISLSTRDVGRRSVLELVVVVVVSEPRNPKCSCSSQLP
jgi:hypothetical protein